MAQQRRISPHPLFTRRRFLQYSGTAALGSSFLAACAGTGTTTNNDPNLPSLTQWYHQYGEAGTHDAVMRYAKDYTKANVSVQWVPGTGGEYPDKVRTALIGSNPPDVFELPQPTLDQVKAGQLEPLDDIINAVKDDFSPVSLKPLTINGKIYGIKMLNDMCVIYYRKSLLQQANIEPPTTFDELIEASKKLSTGDVKGLYIGSDAGVDAWQFNLGWSTGGDFLTDDNKIVFNTDRMAAAYEKLRDLKNSGGLLPDAATFWWAPDPFMNGTCAMQWCGLWAMPQVQEALGDDFGIIPLPSFDAEGVPVTPFGGWAEMVAAQGPNVEAAKEYVKWLWIDSAEIQKDWNVGYGFHVPPRKSTAAETEELKSGPAAEAVEILDKYGKALSPIWTSAMGTALTDAVSLIINNNADARAELDKAADKCQSELDKLL